MPWHVEHRGDEYCVIKDSDDSSEGCHDTQEEARRHMAALYANENESDTGITFDDPEVAASFKADAGSRTITGLLVPWGKVARSGFAKWRFSPNSLHWSDDTKRVKLNLGHERAETVGVATRLQTSGAGLYGTFKVARGEKGDQALSLAEDGVLDGFSIEVDFDDGDGWTEDSADADVRLVGSASLRAAALTGYPAFDDARVDRIAAARSEGVKMTAEKEEVTLETDKAQATFETALERLAGTVTDSHNKLTTELTTSIGESVSAGVKAAMEDIAGSEDRGVVRAARYMQIREEPVYRFNGTGDSLIRDAWYAKMEQDHEASERIGKYRRQQEEMNTLVTSGQVQFTPQTTSTASQVIPPGYRPDLYVTQLQQGRPMVSAASSGSIPNATPFTVPTFTSATSVTADHVEGTNPSDGSLAFGTKTVTPQAISGRLTLSREIVDSSNPAIDQIAFDSMRESYARQTEGKVYTLLNGANGSGGTITTGFVPSGAQAVTVAGGTDNQGLVKQIRASIASYAFARFASPTVALMGAGATGRLANAVDTTQRPLFPYIGTTNSVGNGNSVTGAWNVDGLDFIPAWAATGVAAGDTQIFILNRSDLWVWESPLLTFRFEEKQGPANIELNVFGYFATHLLRPVGLSGIRIT